MKKVKLHNLRVNGNRIPQDIWNRVAEILLPGPAPTEADKKHGKSKSAVLKRICATDSDKRKQAKTLAADFMSAESKAEAVKAGWIQPTSDSNAIEKYRAEMRAVEQAEIAEKGFSTLTRPLNGEETESLLAKQLAGLAEIPTDEDLAEIEAILKGERATVKWDCEHCGSPATRELNRRHYCDQHGSK